MRAARVQHPIRVARCGGRTFRFSRATRVDQRVRPKSLTSYVLRGVVGGGEKIEFCILTLLTKYLYTIRKNYEQHAFFLCHIVIIRNAYNIVRTNTRAGCIRSNFMNFVL